MGKVKEVDGGFEVDGKFVPESAIGDMARQSLRNMSYMPPSGVVPQAIDGAKAIGSALANPANRAAAADFVAGPESPILGSAPDGIRKSVHNTIAGAQPLTKGAEDEPDLVDPAKAHAAAVEHEPGQPAVPQAAPMAAPKIGMGTIGQAVQYSSIPKADQEKISAANADMVKAQAQKTEVETQAARRLENAEAAEAQRQAEANAMREKAEQKRQAEEAAQLQKSQDAIDEIRNQKIDPDRFWKKAGTGAHIAGTIAIALGELGSKLSGGPNTALKIIDDKIGRDIDAQKAEISKAKDIASLQHNQLAQLMQKGMSIRQAEQTMHLAKNEQAQQQIRAQLATGGDDRAKAQGAVIQASLQKEAADLNANLHKTVVMEKRGPTINGVPMAMMSKGKPDASAARSQAGLAALDELEAQIKSGKAVDYDAMKNVLSYPIGAAIKNNTLRGQEQETIAGMLPQLMSGKLAPERALRITNMMRSVMKANAQIPSSAPVAAASAGGEEE